MSKQNFTREEVLTMLDNLANFMSLRTFGGTYFSQFEIQRDGEIREIRSPSENPNSLFKKLIGTALTKLEETLTNETQLNAAKSALRSAFHGHLENVLDSVMDSVSRIFKDDNVFDIEEIESIKKMLA